VCYDLIDESERIQTLIEDLEELYSEVDDEEIADHLEDGDPESGGDVGAAGGVDLVVPRFPACHTHNRAGRPRKGSGRCRNHFEAPPPITA